MGGARRRCTKCSQSGLQRSGLSEHTSWHCMTRHSTEQHDPTIRAAAMQHWTQVAPRNSQRYFPHSSSAT